jgi:hypothetical protein
MGRNASQGLREERVRLSTIQRRTIRRAAPDGAGEILNEINFGHETALTSLSRRREKKHGLSNLLPPAARRKDRS